MKNLSIRLTDLSLLLYTDVLRFVKIPSFLTKASVDDKPSFTPTLPKKLAPPIENNRCKWGILLNALTIAVPILAPAVAAPILGATFSILILKPSPNDKTI